MTIFGQHTVHELDDLLKALSYEVDQISRASADCAAWKQRDPQGYSAWTSEWSKFIAEWAHVSHVAMRRVELTPHATWDYVPLEDDYQRLLRAFQPSHELERRFLRESQCTVTMSAVPQPTAPDFDLQAYQAADSATKWIEGKAVNLTVTTKRVVPVILGGVGLTIAAVLLARRAVIRASARALGARE